METSGSKMERLSLRSTGCKRAFKSNSMKHALLGARVSSDNEECILNNPTRDSSKNDPRHSARREMSDVSMSSFLIEFYHASNYSVEPDKPARELFI